MGRSTPPPLTLARRRRAFTLLEMVLVTVIIAVLATIVVINFAGRTDTVNLNVTKTRIGQVRDAVQEYYSRFGSYPPNLEALVSGGMLTKIPQDPWNRNLVYIIYADAAEGQRPYDLYSLGKDGIAGNADDISVWTMENRK
ncbi:MAG: type II secretion system protein GspG [Phycisphaerae bacterium]|nr:type II secretion system protein GspG [Phycisphaerae bacterium]